MNRAAIGFFVVIALGCAAVGAEKKPADPASAKRAAVRSLIAAAAKEVPNITDEDDEIERSMTYSLIAEAQAKTGDLAGAEMSLAKIRQLDDKARVNCEIAKGHIQAGEVAGARKSLKAAETATVKISQNWFKASCYCEIASTYIQAKDMADARKCLEAAKAAAAGMHDSREKFDTYRQIAAIEMQLGDKAGACKSLDVAAATLSHLAVDHDYYFRAVAEDQAKAGNVRGRRRQRRGLAASINKRWHSRPLPRLNSTMGIWPAKATASQIRDDHTKAETYCAIAAAQAKSGAITAAKATVRISTTRRKNSQAYLCITEAQADAGNIAEAQATLSQIRDGEWKERAYEMIAAAQMKAKNMAGARQSLDLAETMATQIGDEEAHARIARERIRAGDVAGAKATMAKIKGEKDPDEAHHMMAELQSSLGNIAGAMAAAEQIEERQDQVPMYCKICEVQAKNGDMAGARRSLGLAKSSAMTLSKMAMQNLAGDLREAHQTIVVMQAKIGEVAEAIDYCARVETDPWYRCTCLTEAAIQLSSDPEP